jgi:hypothetical protein
MDDHWPTAFGNVTIRGVTTRKARFRSDEECSPLAILFASQRLRTDILARLAEARELHRALHRRHQAVVAYSLAVRVAVQRSARRRTRSRSG